MLITQYAAADEAGVTRQTIYKQTKQKPRPMYFVDILVEKEKVIRVDNDHELWKAYKQKLILLKGKRGKENQRFQDLIDAVVSAIREKYNPSKEEEKELLIDIDRRFRGV